MTMADSVKAQRLAAAKRMLKQHQKTQKPTKQGTSESPQQNGNEQSKSVENSSHSPNPQLQQYFNDVVSFANVSSSFFDQIPENKQSDIPEVAQANLSQNSHDTSEKSDDLQLETESLPNSHHSDVVETENIESYSNADTQPASLVFNPPQSSMESLLQLSSQINHLIDDNSMYDTTSMTTQLENRNQELAALLDNEKLESEKLLSQLQEASKRIEKLEQESTRNKIDYEQKLTREIGPLQEQLQHHIQAVGILLGDKTELSTELTQNQSSLKQKITECEELQGRLKTSRSRVADLEKELVSLRADSFNSHTINEKLQEIDRLKMKLKETFDSKSELEQDVLELREKLNRNEQERTLLRSRADDVENQLSLAQIKIQQITIGDEVQVGSQIEELTQEKIRLEKVNSELVSSLQSANNERDQLSTQYQQYVQQLNSQVRTLASRLGEITQDNEALEKREQDLIKHISELERHLQTVQNEQLNNVALKQTIAKEDQSVQLLEDANKTIDLLKTEAETLRQQLEKLNVDNGLLRQEVSAKTQSIESLETVVQQYRENRPDNGKLLAAMESDKVAASRAVAQNGELKAQLDEMQKAFVKMTNDKVDLTEELTTEQYRTRELQEKLNLVEHQLRTLTEAIEIKDRELMEERHNLEHVDKRLLQLDQLEDRLRHYEAQDNGSATLQTQLIDLQARLKIVMEENEMLKLQGHSETDGPKLEVENDSSILNKEAAMKRLEDKFRKTMEDIAELTEEKQRLEHIVLQLQGETETIGEYIALYQHQRGILQQRTYEKDEQLKQLAHDRDQVKNKLDLLNNLVRKLVQEKGALTSDIIEHQEQLNQRPDLCNEHAKMHREINNQIDSVNNRDNQTAETETAKEIINLLSDIKYSNLVNPMDGLESFHPCLWCSGQLMTV